MFNLDALLALPIPVPPPADPVPDAGARRVLMQVAELQRVNAAVLRKLREYQDRGGVIVPANTP
jgi:hypothetical protein